MSLLERIKDMLGEEFPVGESPHVAPGGMKMVTYSVNVHGPVLQFALPADEDNEGVIEDFLEYVEASVLKQARNS